MAEDRRKSQNLFQILSSPPENIAISIMTAIVAAMPIVLVVLVFGCSRHDIDGIVIGHERAATGTLRVKVRVVGHRFLGDGVLGVPVTQDDYDRIEVGDRFTR